MEELNITITMPFNLVTRPGVRTVFVTKFDEQGPPCPICGRRLSPPFDRRKCKPHKQEPLADGR